MNSWNFRGVVLRDPATDTGGGGGGAAPAAAPPPTFDSAAASVGDEIDSMFDEPSLDADDAEVEEPAVDADPAPAGEDIETEVDPVIDPAVEVAADPAIEAAPTEPVDDLVDDGKQVKDAKGRDWVKYPKARGVQVFAGYQASRELARELTGDADTPLTPELIKGVLVDKGSLDNLLYDAVSPEPAEQQRAFQYLFRRAVTAYEANHVAHDPTATMPQTILAAASAIAPGVVDGLEKHFQGKIIDGMYDQAMKLGHKIGEPGARLWNTAQNLDKTYRNTFRDRKDVKVVDPNDAKIAELRGLEAKQTERVEAEREQQWSGYLKSTSSLISGAVDKHIETILKPLTGIVGDVRKSLVLRLRTEVREAIDADVKFNENRRREYQQARIAGSESVRDLFQKLIVEQFAAKSNQILRAKAQTILKAHAAQVTKTSATEHQRLQATQRTRTTPNGEPAASTPKPSETGSFSRGDYERELTSLLG